MDTRQFADGRISLVNGDWFLLYNQIVEKQSIDFAIVDPPWGVLGECQKWDTGINLPNLETTLDYCLKPTGQLAFFCDLKLSARVLAEFTEFEMRCYHIWQKYLAMPKNKWLPINNTEIILILKRKGTKLNELPWNPKSANAGIPYSKTGYQIEVKTRRMKKSGKSINEDGRRWLTTTIHAPSKPNMLKSERTDHATQKSEQLIRTILKSYCNDNSLILDPTFGSGSSIVSAWREGHSAIGCELEKEFFTSASNRLDMLTKQQNLFNNQKQEANYA
ncbi:MAG: hypothetical protein GWP19_00615 [Planctomycetia bacterium]|nr:hypothetical protein [Planctomycetia bacterium]